jgi:hypothetical protein
MFFFLRIMTTTMCSNPYELWEINLSLTAPSILPSLLTWIRRYMPLLLKKYVNTELIIITVPLILFRLSLLLLPPLTAFTVSLCEFYFHRLIEKPTVFLQLQELRARATHTLAFSLSPREWEGSSENDINTYTHKHKHTHTNTQTHKHKHTHTHTHTQVERARAHIQ